MKFKSLFFSIIIMSLVAIAIGTWINEWNEDYQSGLTYDIAEFNHLDEMSAEAQSQQGNIPVTGVSASDISSGDFEGTSLKGVFSILNNIYEPFRVIFGDGGMIDAVTDRFGIPNSIRITLVTMIIMAVTLTLVAIIFRRSTDDI